MLNVIFIGFFTNLLNLTSPNEQVYDTFGWTVSEIENDFT